MKNSISECKHLIVDNGVVLNELLTDTICALDDRFEAEDFTAFVTSGIRTAQKQLSLIVLKSKEHGVDRDFPEILVATVENKYSWLKPWGRLLVLGEMINPPLPAEAPFEYKKPNGDVRPAGTRIDISNHMKAHSFDIARADLNKITAIVKKAIEEKTCPSIKGFLTEPMNKAVHIDCQEVKLDNF